MALLRLGVRLSLVALICTALVVLCVGSLLVGVAWALLRALGPARRAGQLTMDPWRVLGVAYDADAAAVHAAYRRLARQHHPDRGGSTVRMREINAAYALLRSVRRFGPPSAACDQPADGSCSTRAAHAVRALATRHVAAWMRGMRSWLAGDRAGQWLTTFGILCAIHWIGESAPEGLAALAAILALRLQVQETPAGRSFAPAHDTATVGRWLLQMARRFVEQW